MLGEDFEAVLDAVRDGDEDAFARLYRDLHPALLRYLTVLSVGIAEDAASETWLEVARSLDGFTGGEQQFRAWVFTLARRKVIDRVRYEARRPTVAWDGELPGPADDAVQRDVADDVVEHESTRRALAMLATLPPDQAEAVLLRVVAGLDYSVVAGLMDRSPGAVRVLVHRGLRTLARTQRPTPAGGGV
jgi:RNA polymerase sigma-70 factor (ECF subfamily)